MLANFGSSNFVHAIFNNKEVNDRYCKETFLVPLVTRDIESLLLSKDDRS